MSLNKERGFLKEYSAFKDLKLEIQIRSILQHTWAEIEHDIGYKSELEVPKSIRRKFSRMAGLLELADQEFDAIRVELKNYKKTSDAQAIKHPEKVLLDKVTFTGFVTGDELCKELDNLVVDTCRFTLLGAPKNAAKQLQALGLFGIDTVDKLKKSLAGNKEAVIRRIEDVSKSRAKARVGVVSPGISIFYLTQVLASNDKGELLDRFCEMRGFGENFKQYLRGLELSKAEA